MEGGARATPGKLGCAKCNSSENRSAYLCAKPRAAVLDTSDGNKAFLGAQSDECSEHYVTTFCFLGGICRISEINKSVWVSERMIAETQWPRVSVH